MKVLQINSFFSVGGPPKIMNGIYSALSKVGIECKILAAREKMYAPKDSLRIGSSLGVKRNALFARIFDNEGFNSKKATKKLVQQIQEYDPDVIHLHNLHGYYIHTGILFEYLKKAGKPVVWTIHDCWPFTGHCTHFDYINCEKWRNGCVSCPQKKEYPASVFLNRAKKNYKKKQAVFNGVNNLTLVLVSKWLQGIARHSFLKGYSNQVIYNGINLDVFKPTESILREKLGLANKKVVLGVAQNWGVKKGIYDFNALAETLNMEQYSVVLIGIPKKWRKKLSKNILFVDQTNESRALAEYYSMADVFLNLSYEETFGLVTLEALACGTPVIVYDKTAVPEIVDADCGVIVPAGDIESVRRNIQIMDKKVYKDACIRKAQSFDYQKGYLQYIDLYQSLVMEKNK